MFLSRKALTILIFLANSNTICTMEIEEWRIVAAQRRAETFLNHIKPYSRDIRGEIMNNSTNSAFYAFLASAALLTGTAGAMEDGDITGTAGTMEDWGITSMLISPNTDQSDTSLIHLTSPSDFASTPYRIKTTDYDGTFVRLEKLITTRSNYQEIEQCLLKLSSSTKEQEKKQTIYNISRALSDQDFTQEKIDTLQQALQSIRPTTKQEQTFQLPNLFDSWNAEAQKKCKEQKDRQQLETLFECAFNQLYRLQSNIQKDTSLQTASLVETLQGIIKLLPENSALRKKKINPIIESLINNQPLTDDFFTQSNQSIAEAELLSISPDSPNKIVENSFIQREHLIKKGDLCPSPIDTSGFASFIVAQKGIPNSLKIYLLQLMWWQEMSNQQNKLKQFNSANAKDISNALRTIASKKDSTTGCVTYLSDGYSRNNDKHYNNDRYCDGSEYYSTAILPSIIHNPGEAPAPQFHDQDANKQLLDQLIEKLDLNFDFKIFLTNLKKVSEKPVPEYDNTQPQRKAETIPVKLQELITSGKHFPLTKETLNHPKLPESFKLLLEKYLQRNEPTEQEKNISALEQKIQFLQEIKEFLKNYITNISTHPTKHPHFGYQEWDPEIKAYPIFKYDYREEKKYLKPRTNSKDTYKIALNDFFKAIINFTEASKNTDEDKEFIQNLNRNITEEVEKDKKKWEKKLRESIERKIAKITERIKEIEAAKETLSALDQSFDLAMENNDVRTSHNQQPLITIPVIDVADRITSETVQANTSNSFIANTTVIIKSDTPPQQSPNQSLLYPVDTGASVNIYKNNDSFTNESSSSSSSGDEDSDGQEPSSLPEQQYQDAGEIAEQIPNNVGKYDSYHNSADYINSFLHPIGAGVDPLDSSFSSFDLNALRISHNQQPFNTPEPQNRQIAEQILDNNEEPATPYNPTKCIEHPIQQLKRKIAFLEKRFNCTQEQLKINGNLTIQVPGITTSDYLDQHIYQKLQTRLRTLANAKCIMPRLIQYLANSWIVAVAQDAHNTKIIDLSHKSDEKTPSLQDYIDKYNQKTWWSAITESFNYWFLFGWLK
jgi:hypothetical protein